MRDPRNWVRPVAAVADRHDRRRRARASCASASSTAGARAKASGPIDLAERTLHAVADETRQILDR